jgi:hypothetical protein
MRPFPSLYRKGPERRKVPVNQRLFFGASPTFGLPLGGDGIGDGVEMLLKNQLDWSSTGGEAAKRPIIVLGDPGLKPIARCADVVGTVATANDVEISSHV